MALQGGSIGTWKEMNKTFSNKCKYYCKMWETRDEFFCMTQRADETLEDYVERCKLDDESLQLVFLRGVREEFMEALDLIVVGDIY